MTGATAAGRRGINALPHDTCNMSVDCIDPVKVNYDDFLSWESKHRVRSGLKKLRPYFDTPGIISVGGRQQVM